MRDIRQDLRQWLQEIRDQKGELERLEQAVQTTLAAQEECFERQFPLFGSAAIQAVDSDAIAEFLETTMSDDRPWSVDELVEAAHSKGIVFGDKNPKRVVNMSIVNLYNNKKVEKAGEKVWRRKHRDAETVTAFIAPPLPRM